MTEIRERIAGPFFALKGMPATIADPELGAISVPNVRTVVVLPAPFGPRNPNTSPLATLNETSDTAVRPPKTLVRWLTSMATGAAREACPARALPASPGPSYAPE